MTARIVRVGNTISLVSPDSGEHKHIRAGLAELVAGQSVSNERVTEWLDSWGTENELPAPK
jgi:predicted transcriptional regulator